MFKKVTVDITNSIFYITEGEEIVYKLKVLKQKHELTNAINLKIIVTKNVEDDEKEITTVISKVSELQKKIKSLIDFGVIIDTRTILELNRKILENFDQLEVAQQNFIDTGIADLLVEDFFKEICQYIADNIKEFKDVDKVDEEIEPKSALLISKEAYNIGNDLLKEIFDNCCYSDIKLVELKKALANKKYTNINGVGRTDNVIRVGKKTIRTNSFNQMIVDEKINELEEISNE